MQMQSWITRSAVVLAAAMQPLCPICFVILSQINLVGPCCRKSNDITVILLAITQACRAIAVPSFPFLVLLLLYNFEQKPDSCTKKNFARIVARKQKLSKDTDGTKNLADMAKMAVIRDLSSHREIRSVSESF